MLAGSLDGISLFSGQENGHQVMEHARGDAAVPFNAVCCAMHAQGTGARAAKVNLDKDTKVFEEGAVGKIPGGGSLTTYQELCSLATGK